VLSVFGKGRSKVKVQQPFDVYLFFTTLLLVMVGIMMIFSSSAILAKARYDDTYYFLKKELLFFAIGLVTLFLLKNISYKMYQKFVYPIFFFWEWGSCCCVLCRA